MAACTSSCGRVLFLVSFISMCALSSMAQPAVEVTAHLEGTSNDKRARAPYAALWLVPMPSRATPPFTPGARKYTLLQKNKMFSPHLLIVPVGAVVSFPNGDPFFHNVFSLFDGKRFDLGLYEAGSTKEVTFSREGVSYIFCNIHPGMSAVVLTLSTPYFSSGDDRGIFRLHGIPPGSYEMHLWIEGVEQKVLLDIARLVSVTGDHANLGGIKVPAPFYVPAPHTNKFGEIYNQKPGSPY